MLVDSHCHLEYEGLVESQSEVLDRARGAGVGAFLNISTKRAEWGQVVGTANAKPDVWASVGIHPHNADDHPDLTREELLELGPLLENHRIFPRRINVQLAVPLGPRAIDILIWERGAGETQASGSSSCIRAR